jgi:hypothetical protein
MTQEKSATDDPLAADETLRESERDLTPPHGDQLRSEVTFGRTDRYSNVDDENAARQPPAPEENEEDAEE